MTRPIRFMHGNLVLSGLSGTDYTGTRATSTTYALDGYFPIAVSNAENHTVATVIEPREGNPLEITDEKGLLAQFEYDVFGRETERWYPDFAGADKLAEENHYAPRTSTAYAWKTGCPGAACVDRLAAYGVTVLTDGAGKGKG